MSGTLCSACFISIWPLILFFHLQGCTELHHHIYQLIFRLFKWKNVKLEVCLAMLWECRRLSHALCPSPISDAFIQTLSENCADKSTCIDFWMDCLKDSKAKLIGFQQNFHDLHNKDEGPFQSDITIDDIKDAASELISSVRNLSYIEVFPRKRISTVIIQFC